LGVEWFGEDKCAQDRQLAAQMGEGSPTEWLQPRVRVVVG
jgi:hypothetical protein